MLSVFRALSFSVITVKFFVFFGVCMINKITISIAVMLFTVSSYAQPHLGCSWGDISKSLGVGEHVHNQEKFLYYLAATDIYQENCNILSFIGFLLKKEGVNIHTLDLGRLGDYDSYNEGHRVSWFFYRLKGCNGIYERFEKFGLEMTLIPLSH